MKSILFLVFVASVLAEDPPTVEPFDCSTLEATNGFDRCMSFTFPDGTVKEARLKKVRGKDTVLSGDIVGDDDSHVSITFLDGKMDVVINDPEHGFFAFEYDSSMKPHNLKFGGDNLKDGKAGSNRNLDPVTYRSGMKPLPAVGFDLDVHVFYDREFKVKFAKNGEDGIYDRIYSVFAHVENFFLLKSLGTKIYPNIVGIDFVDDVYDPDSSTGNKGLDDFSSYVGKGIKAGKLDKSTNSFLMLSLHNKGKYLGLAYASTTCGSDASQKTAISEWNMDDVNSAATLVHEIAHNLGMDDEYGKPRFDSKGNRCKNGFMDAELNPNHWSVCSKEQLTAYWNANNDPKFCLKDHIQF